MKRYLVLLTALLLIMCQGNAQDNQKSPADSTPVAQKLYFPAKLHADSMALTWALPQLARQVVSGLSEKDKKEFSKTVSLYLVAEDYPKTVETVDSLQMKTNDLSESMELKSYAVARMREKQGGKNFAQVFSDDFKAAFDQLSFRKKVSLAMLDTSLLQMVKSEYDGVLEKVIGTKGDSLELEEAKSLIEKTAWYTIARNTFPLMIPMIVKDPYRTLYPAIKGSLWGGVVPVQGITEFADSGMTYKLLMELTAFASKGQEKEATKMINGGISEIARKINLHVAAGIPPKNISVVVAIHAGAIFAFLNNEQYKKKYKADNPNLAIIKELQDFGVKFIVCGQAMTFLKTEDENLVPGIKLALTAQTVLSTYQQKGYTYYDIRLD